MHEQFIASGGEYRKWEIGEVFDIRSSKKKLHAKNVAFGGQYPYVARGNENNGIKGYVSENPAYLNEGNTISFGQDTATLFYQEKPYFTGDKIKVLSLMDHPLNRKLALYLITCMRNAFAQFAWGAASCSEAAIASTRIALPTLSTGEIAFGFISSSMGAIETEHTTDLKVYLAQHHLDSSTLSEGEENALHELESVTWGFFPLKELFNHIQQGKRLKNSDQEAGDTPFIMSGRSNMGIVNSVSNPTRSFPANSITIDIFGNTFYRDFAFGAGDDTGVYWSDTKDYSQNQMLFLAATIEKALKGKYSYSRKLRSSQSKDITIPLPINPEGDIDYPFMEALVGALLKLRVASVQRTLTPQPK